MAISHKVYEGELGQVQKETKALAATVSTFSFDEVTRLLQNRTNRYLDQVDEERRKGGQAAVDAKIKKLLPEAYAVMAVAFKCVTAAREVIKAEAEAKGHSKEDAEAISMKANQQELARAYDSIPVSQRSKAGYNFRDTQVLGAAAMDSENFAQMATGEGKTYTFMLTGYLQSLRGIVDSTGHTNEDGRVTIETANNTLAREGFEDTIPCYSMVGVGSGYADESAAHESPEKKLAYAGDRTNFRAWITYVSSNGLKTDVARNKTKTKEADMLDIPLTGTNRIDEVDDVKLNQGLNATKIIEGNQGQGISVEALEEINLVKAIWEQVSQPSKFFVGKTEKKKGLLNETKYRLAKESVSQYYAKRIKKAKTKSERSELISEREQARASGALTPSNSTATYYDKVRNETFLTGAGKAKIDGFYHHYLGMPRQPGEPPKTRAEIEKMFLDAIYIKEGYIKGEDYNVVNVEGDNRIVLTDKNLKRNQWNSKLTGYLHMFLEAKHAGDGIEIQPRDASSVEVTTDEVHQNFHNQAGASGSIEGRAEAELEEISGRKTCDIPTDYEYKLMNAPTNIMPDKAKKWAKDNDIHVDLEKFKGGNLRKFIEDANRSEANDWAKKHHIDPKDIISLEGKRMRLPPRVYENQAQKEAAIVDTVVQAYREGQPVLLRAANDNEAARLYAMINEKIARIQPPIAGQPAPSLLTAQQQLVEGKQKLDVTNDDLLAIKNELITSFPGGLAEYNATFHDHELKNLAKIRQKSAEVATLTDAQLRAKYPDDLKNQSILQYRKDCAGVANLGDAEILNELRADLEQKFLKKHMTPERKEAINEREIVKNGGRRGSIIVSTDMAGRGTDIKIKKAEELLGGLFTIATQPGLDSKNDKQFFGRAGRKGQRGIGLCFLCKDDDIVVQAVDKKGSVYSKEMLIRRMQSMSPRQLQKFITHMQVQHEILNEMHRDNNRKVTSQTVATQNKMQDERAQKLLDTKFSSDGPQQLKQMYGEQVQSWVNGLCPGYDRGGAIGLQRAIDGVQGGIIRKLFYRKDGAYGEYDKNIDRQRRKGQQAVDMPFGQKVKSALGTAGKLGLQVARRYGVPALLALPAVAGIFVGLPAFVPVVVSMAAFALPKVATEKISKAIGLGPQLDKFKGKIERWMNKQDFSKVEYKDIVNGDMQVEKVFRNDRKYYDFCEKVRAQTGVELAANLPWEKAKGLSKATLVKYIRKNAEQRYDMKRGALQPVDRVGFDEEVRTQILENEKMGYKKHIKRTEGILAHMDMRKAVNPLSKKWVSNIANFALVGATVGLSFIVPPLAVVSGVAFGAKMVAGKVMEKKTDPDIEAQYRTIGSFVEEKAKHAMNGFASKFGKPPREHTQKIIEGSPSPEHPLKTAPQALTEKDWKKLIENRTRGLENVLNRRDLSMVQKLNEIRDVQERIAADSGHDISTVRNKYNKHAKKAVQASTVRK